MNANTGKRAKTFAKPFLLSVIVAGTAVLAAACPADEPEEPTTMMPDLDPPTTEMPEPMEEVAGLRSAEPAAADAEAGCGCGRLILRKSFHEYRNVTRSVDPVQVYGGGFQAGETVTLEIPNGTSNPIETATANSSGAVDFGDVVLPSTPPPIDAPIVYTLRAVGADSGIVAVAVAIVDDDYHN